MSSLVNCPTCQNLVSKSALSCPSCGEILQKPKRSVFGKVVLWIFWLFNILIVAWIWMIGKSTTENFMEVSEAERFLYGVAGITFVIIIWLIGAIILGIMALLTRPK